MRSGKQLDLYVKIVRIAPICAIFLLSRQNAPTLRVLSDSGINCANYDTGTVSKEEISMVRDR